MSEAALTPETILAALDEVIDPDLGESIVAMEMIKDLKVENDAVSLTCELTTPACPMSEQIEAHIRDTLARHFPQLKEVRLKMTGRVRGAVMRDGRLNLLPQVRNVILIASGKGGVGKSTVALNLALALHGLGAKVGLLDLDLHGPALASLLGLEQKPKVLDTSRIKPLECCGVQVMSMGVLVEPNQPMLWRGTILQGLVEQFLRDVAWAESDYLLVDLPPGPGEIALAAAQCCAGSAAVLITTPQAASVSVVARYKALCDQLQLPVLGVIENMSGEEGAHASSGGGRRFAEEAGLPFLGAIPFDPAVSAAGDAGKPYLLGAPGSPTAQAFVAAAQQLAAQAAKRQAAAGTGTPPQ